MTEREELEAAYDEANIAYYTVDAAWHADEATYTQYVAARDASLAAMRALAAYDNAHKGRNQMTKREKLEAKIKAADAACVSAEVAWNAAYDAYHAAEADLKAYDDAHKGEIK